MAHIITCFMAVITSVHFMLRLVGWNALITEPNQYTLVALTERMKCFYLLPRVLADTLINLLLDWKAPNKISICKMFTALKTFSVSPKRPINLICGLLKLR